MSPLKRVVVGALVGAVAGAIVRAIAGIAIGVTANEILGYATGSAALGGTAGVVKRVSIIGDFSMFSQTHRIPVVLLVILLATVLLLLPMQTANSSNAMPEDMCDSPHHNQPESGIVAPLQTYPFEVYNDPNWSGTWCLATEPKSANIHSSCNDQTSSVYLRTGWSVRLYRDQNQGGPSICFNRSDENLNNNTFQDNSPMDNAISSFTLYDQPWCAAPPSPAYPLEVYNDANYGGHWCYSTEAKSANIHSSCNDQITSILLRSGWSIRVYRDQNQSGPSRCLNSSDSDMSNNTFENGSPMNDAISSFVLYDHTDCEGTPGPTPTPSPTDLGFRPNPDGYSFANYGKVNLSDYTINDMRRMFGDNAVCWMVRSLCIPKPAAAAWNLLANLSMDGGHCDGMASTSLRFYKGLDTPSSFQSGANTTHDLQKDNIRRHIAYYFVEQLTDPVRSYKKQICQQTPSAILDQLRAAMSGGAPDPTTLFVRPPEGGGHAITPYATEYRGNGEYWVRVYDNNHPDDANRHVIVNTNDNTWSYDLGSSTWSGNSNTHSMGIVPISQYAQQPVCPWCKNTSTTGIASQTPIGEVWFNGKGHLLISNTQGQRIGYVGDQFVSEIPGAYGGFIDTGIGIEYEPIYVLPLDKSYTILLDGQTLTQSETVEVTQFGPGYVAMVNDVDLGPYTQDQIAVSPDGKQLTYQSGSGQEATLILILETSSESHQFTIAGADIGPDQTVAVGIDTDDDLLMFTSAQSDGGMYGINIERVSASAKRKFVHYGVGIFALDTHYLGYGAWDGSGSMTLFVDRGSDGTIDETVPLNNQTEIVFLPLILLR